MKIKYRLIKFKPYALRRDVYNGETQVEIPLNRSDVVELISNLVNFLANPEEKTYELCASGEVEESNES